MNSSTEYLMLLAIMLTGATSSWALVKGLDPLLIFIIGLMVLSLTLFIVNQTVRYRANRQHRPNVQDHVSNATTAQGVALSFDLLKDKIEDRAWTIYYVRVGNKTSTTIKIAIVFVSVEPSNHDEELRDQLTRFRDIPLIPANAVNDDTAIDFPDTFEVFPSQSMSFAFVAYARGDPPSLRICHSKFSEGARLSGTGIPLRSTLIDETIPLGKYTIKMRCIASDGSNKLKCFRVVATKERQRFEVSEIAC